ncbi:MAG: UxaA family hydrolase, partial [Anaerolineae bacterium]
MDNPRSNQALLDQVTVRLHPQDDVAIAKVDLESGQVLQFGAEALAIRANVPSGHKVALRALAAGDAVRRYGQVIGFATRDIAPGDHVHTHNLGVQDFDREVIEGREIKSM